MDYKYTIVKYLKNIIPNNLENIYKKHLKDVAILMCMFLSRHISNYKQNTEHKVKADKNLLKNWKI